ncbi:hypothetical protein VaNZ11_002594, partial [Volvox africanus]
IAHHTADPVFNWQFDLRLPADLFSGSDGAAAAAEPTLLYFRVLNARTLGEPEILSHAVMDANMLGLKINEEVRPKLLELTAGAAGGKGGGWTRGTLSLQISWLKALPKRASPFPQDAGRTAAVPSPLPPTQSHHSHSNSVATSTAAAAAASPAAVQSGSYQSQTAAWAAAAASAAAASAHGGSADGGGASAGANAATITQRRTELFAPSGVAGAFDMLTARMQDVAGSAPMYGIGGGGSGSFMADEGSFGVSRFGMGSSRSLGPMQNTPHLPLEESLAGGKAHNSKTMPEARVVRHGPHDASLDSGSWQSLTTDTVLPHLNGGGGRGNGAGKNNHATTNVGSNSSRGDVAAPATAPLAGITTPRRSMDTTTEGGSASGLASSSASGPVPMVFRRLRKTAFRKSGGSSGGGGGGGSGAPGSPGGAVMQSAAVERKAAEQPGPPGKHRRAIRGLFGFGSWKGRSSHVRESAPAAAAAVVAAVVAAAATQLPPSARLSLTEAHDDAHSLIRASGDSQDTEIKGEQGFCDTAAAAAAELTTDGVDASGVAANAAAASTAATGVSRGSFEGLSLEPRGFGSPFSAEICSKSGTPRTTAASGGAASASPQMNGVAAMVTPPPLLPPRLKLNFSPSPPRVDQDRKANACSTAASYLARTSVDTRLRAATAATAATTAAAVILGDGLDSLVFDAGALGAAAAAAAAAGEEELSASVSEHPGQSHRMQPDVVGLTEGLSKSTPPPHTPPLPPRASISLSPLPDLEELPSPQRRQQRHHLQEQWEQLSLQHVEQKGQGQGHGHGQVDKSGDGCASQQLPDSPLAQELQQRQESAAAAMPPDVVDPTRRLSICLSAPSAIKKAHASGPVAAAIAADSGGSGDGDGDSIAAMAAAHGPLNPSSIPTATACVQTAVASLPPVLQQGQQNDSGKQPQLQLLTLSGSRGSAFATPGAAAAATAAANGTSEAQPHAPWSHTRTSNGGAAAASSMSRELNRQLSAISVVSAAAADPGTAAMVSSGPLTAAPPALSAGPLGTSPPPWSSTLQSLAQVLKMQKSLQVERQARAELTEMLSDMTRKYEGMVRIRRFENYRALVEGARFQLHLANEMRRVLMWYNEARDVVQVDPDVGFGSDRSQERTVGLWPRTFAPQELERAERGCAGFPSPNPGWAGVVAALITRFRPTPPEPMRSFSLVLEGGRCLHLQLPPSGNGRSRDEWVDALQDLAATGKSRVAREERAGSTKPSKGLAAGSQQAPVTTAAAPAATAVTAAAGVAGAGAGGGATATLQVAAAVSGSATPQQHNAHQTPAATTWGPAAATAMVAAPTPTRIGNDGGGGYHAADGRVAE